MTKEKNTKGKTVIQLFDWLSFLIVCIVLTNFGKTDPGELIFLFAYENLIILLVFCFFLMISFPLHAYYLNSKSKNSATGAKKNIITEFLWLLIAVIIGLTISFFVLLFMNQLTIELLIGFLQENGYSFKSIELLTSNEVFFELADDFEQALGMNFTLVFFIVAARYLLMLCLQLFFHPEFKENNTISVFGIYKLISNLFMAPVSIFLAMVFLVVLTALFGKAFWIVLISLVIFKFLFAFFSSRLSRFLESI